jgi:hypothetical protein
MGKTTRLESGQSTPTNVGDTLTDNARTGHLYLYIGAVHSKMTNGDRASENYGLALGHMSAILDESDVEIATIHCSTALNDLSRGHLVDAE